MTRQNAWRTNATIAGPDGNPIVIGGLWAITPSTIGSGGDPITIYFTARVKDEAQDVFGSLTPTGTHVMFG